MKIHLAVDLDREEGKTMSAELVGEALVGQIEGESVEVEDSIYSVTSAEATSAAKAKAGGFKPDELLLAVNEVMDAYMKANPINVEGPGHGQPKHLDKETIAAIERLMWVKGLGEATTQAKVRAHKADERPTKLRRG